MAHHSTQSPLGNGRRPTISIAPTINPRRPRRQMAVGGPYAPYHRQTLPPDVDPRHMPHSVPNPSHRHGTPSGPWPFLDLHTVIEPKEILEPNINLQDCAHHRHDDELFCWCKYPQSLFANWTPIQQKASRIKEALGSKHGWHIHHLAIQKDGRFESLEKMSGRFNQKEAFWDDFRPEQAQEYRVHALFVDNMKSLVVQMLGTKYTIEPFFFSSSFGWIPSRYQENPIPNEGDHITITLTFIRCINNPENDIEANDNASIITINEHEHKTREDLVIDTNAPLYLRSKDKILFSDILSLHMVRHPTKGSTIISYHPPREYRATTAKQLHERFLLTGKSVYWCKIFEKSKDPTFAFLSLLWYALYAWDESFEELYSHICVLESEVLENNDLNFTQELHVIRANLLHYSSLLEDFRKTVHFVMDTQYPALNNPQYFTKQEKHESETLLRNECKMLLHEIERLEMSRIMQDRRLKNVMDLGFSSVNLQDSRRMHAMTEAAVRDSAAMKQVAYLTMIFLPATFIATAFGMNVGEINPGSNPTLSQYFATALPMTVVTIWIVVALQVELKPKRKKSPKPAKKPCKKSESKSKSKSKSEPKASTKKRKRPPTSEPNSDSQAQSQFQSQGSGSDESDPAALGLPRAYTTDNGEIVVTSEPYVSNSNPTSKTNSRTNTRSNTKTSWDKDKADVRVNVNDTDDDGDDDNEDDEDDGEGDEDDDDDEYTSSYNSDEEEKEEEYLDPTNNFHSYPYSNDPGSRSGLYQNITELTIWRRLCWPISLTQAYIEEWLEGMERRRRKRKHRSRSKPTKPRPRPREWYEGRKKRKRRNSDSNDNSNSGKEDEEQGVSGGVDVNGSGNGGGVFNIFNNLSRRIGISNRHSSSHDQTQLPQVQQQVPTPTLGIPMTMLHHTPNTMSPARDVRFVIPTITNSNADSNSNQPQPSPSPSPSPVPSSSPPTHDLDDEQRGDRKGKGKDKEAFVQVQGVEEEERD